MCITNLHDSWVRSKSVWNLSFHGFVLFEHKCHTLFKYEKSCAWFLCVNNTNKHIIAMYKQHE
jgi:hypothetical protein